MTTNEQYAGFLDPTELTRWTRVSLCAYMVLSLVSVWTGVADLQDYGGEESLTGLTVIVILRGVGTLVTVAITAILVLTWIHRANHNARQLGAADMKYTPGWAVGWYFVPIAWFWKPYQAMKEVWQASANPSGWHGQTVSPLLHWWWALWILPWGLSLVDWAVGRNLDEAGVEMLEATTGIAEKVLDIPLILVLLVIIGRVHGMQMKHRRRQVAAAGPGG